MEEHAETSNSATEKNNKIKEDMTAAEYLAKVTEHCKYDNKRDDESLSDWSLSEEEMSSSTVSSEDDENGNENVVVPIVKNEDYIPFEGYLTPRPVSVVMDDVKKMLQKPYWSDTALRQVPLTTSSFEANFAEIIESKCGSGSKKITEYQALCEILNSLLGYGTTFLFAFLKNGEIQPSRRTITIPSMTASCFRGFLEAQICPHLNHLATLKGFVKVAMNDKNIPYTYLCYAHGLDNFLKHFYQRVYKFLKEVESRQRTITLLDLLCFDKEFRLMSIAHAIHNSAIADWKNEDSWYCSIRLISILGHEIERNTVAEERGFLTDLLFSSLKFYIHLMGSVTGHGRLDDDHRKEFLIQRNGIIPVQNATFWENALIIHPYEDRLAREGVKPLPFFKDILPLLATCWKTQAILSHLRRVTWLSQDELKLYHSITDTIRKDVLSEIEEPSDVNPEECNDPFFQEMLRHLDPLVVPDFTQIHYNSHFEIFGPKPQFVECHPPSCAKRSEKIILPFGMLLKEKLSALSLRIWNTFRDCLVSDEELAIHKHLKCVQQVFLFQAGDMMHDFCRRICHAIEEEDDWFSMSCPSALLEDCILSTCGDLAYKFSLKVGRNEEQYEIEENVHNHFVCALDSVHLIYKVPWPVSLILDDASLQIYSQVFATLLKQRRVLYCLQQISFHDVPLSHSVGATNEEKISFQRQCAIFRLWLQHFTESFHYYFLYCIADEACPLLNKQMEAAGNMEEIVKAHRDFVSLVQERCFLHPSAFILRDPLSNVLNLALRFVSLWRRGEMSLAELSGMQEKYSSCVCYLSNYLLLKNKLDESRPHLDNLKMWLAESVPAAMCSSSK